MKTKQKEEWEKEFDNLWERLYLHGWSNKKAKERNWIKSFIYSLLKQERQRGLEKLIKVFEKFKDEPMTGKVVLLELKVWLQTLKKEK